MQLSLPVLRALVALRPATQTQCPGITVGCTHALWTLSHMLHNSLEAVKKINSGLHNEFTFFRKLLYKNTNQHRRSQYFHRLKRVQRELLVIERAEWVTDFETFACKFVASSTPQSTISLPMQLEAELFLYRTYCMHLFLTECLQPATLGACSSIANLLSQSFFMPFALANLSVLGRIYSLARQLAAELLSIYSGIGPLLTCFPSDTSSPNPMDGEDIGKSVSLDTGVSNEEPQQHTLNAILAKQLLIFKHHISTSLPNTWQTLPASFKSPIAYSAPKATGVTPPRRAKKRKASVASDVLGKLFSGSSENFGSTDSPHVRSDLQASAQPKRRKVAQSLPTVRVVDAKKKQTCTKLKTNDDETDDIDELFASIISNAKKLNE